MTYSADSDEISNLLKGEYDECSQGVAIYGPDRKLVFCNRIFLEMLNIPEELGCPGTPLTDILSLFAARGDFGPGEIEELVQARLAVIMNHDIYSFQRTLPDGRVIQYSRTFLPNGGFGAIYSDISSRQQAEERFHAAISASLDAFFLLEADRNENGRIVDFIIRVVNARAEKLVNLTRREMLGRRGGDFIPLDEAPGLFEKLVGVIESGIPIAAEMRLVTDYFAAEWISYQVVPVGDGVAVTIHDITNRKKADAKLRRSEAKYRDLIDGLAQGVVVHRNQTTIYANQSLLDLGGYTKDELIGTDIGALADPSEFGKLLEYQQREGSEPIQVKAVRKSGTPIWVEMRGRTIEWNGKPARQLTVTDITDRKAAENALRESEAKFRNLIDGSVHGVFIHQGNRLIYANRALAEIYRCELDDLIGIDPINLIAPEDRDRVLRSRNLERQVDFHELRGLRRDGSLVWLDGVGSIIEWDRQPARQVMVVDITERRRAQEAVRRQAVVFSQLSEAVLISDLERHFIDCNPAAERIFGYTRSEILGMSPLDLIVDRDEWEQRAGGVLETVATKGRWAGEIQFQRRDGTAVIGEVVLAQLFDDDGVQIAMSGVIRDVTENRKAEMALREAHEEAERANAAKSRFLAAASHDLRQPVQALRLLIEALSNMPDQVTILEILKEIRTCTEAMDGLLNAVLDISKLEAGVIKPEKEDCIVDSLLVSLINEFRPSASKKGLELRYVASELPVRTDPVMLQRIVRNFIANAIACTEAGKLLVGCRRHGSRLRIEVWDTGIGIPGHEIDRIFEEFHQIGNPERNPDKGLGLGLAIARGSAALLGHRIALRSQPGKGSVFSVELPLSDLHPGHVEPEFTPAFRLPEENDRFIIVVENEKIVARAVARILRMWGFKVEAFENVEEAVAQAAHFDQLPDAVIADYSLSSSMTGGDFIKFIQETYSADIPSIILTGDTSPERIREAKSLGFQMLHKPTSPEQLRKALDSVLA
ncbi:MAG: PAS domain S-box protein [Sphingomonadales bacterium]